MRARKEAVSLEELGEREVGTPSGEPETAELGAGIVRTEPGGVGDEVVVACIGEVFGFEEVVGAAVVLGTGAGSE